MKRFLLPLLAMLAACSLTSCFQHEMTLRLNKDGSGTLTEETSFGPQALAMFDQLAQFGGGNSDPVGDLSSESKAKDRAAKMGEGVTVQKIEATAKNGGKGGIVTYTFADINKLKLSPEASLKNSIPAMPGAPPVKDAPPMSFTFIANKLLISMPDPEKVEVPEGAGEALGEPGDPAAEEMMKQMLTDTKMSFKIIVEPGIAETNAAFAEGNTITLSDIDFGKIMQSPTGLSQISKLSRTNPAEALEGMKKIGGAKVETKRELTVTLK